MREVPPIDLFNFPFAENPVVIDGRPIEQFKLGSVKGSYNLPDSSVLSIHDCIRSIGNIGINEDTRNIFFLDFPTERIHSQKEGTEWTGTIVKGGFEGFHSAYNFLCSADHEIVTDEEGDYDGTGASHVNILWNHCPEEVPFYPSQISANIFLGSKTNATMDRRVFANLGITHVVNATTTEPNKFICDGVRYLRCAVEDDEAQPMVATFVQVSGLQVQ
jgi:hypothetical protein